MPAFNPQLRAQPPQCTQDHPEVRGVRRKRSDCPECHRWDKWLQATRRDQVKTGERRIKTRAASLRPVVRAHRCPVDPKYRAGCAACLKWSRYVNALRRQAVREGTLERNVPSAMVTAHVKALVDPKTGGWHLRDIAQVSGVAIDTISDIVNGDRAGAVFATTWNALRVLKPKGKPAPRVSAMVDGTEVRRTMRGLAAQGWTFEHMAGLMGKATKAAATRLAGEKRSWVQPETVDEVRRLRDKLAGFDIAALTEPLPGMNRRCAAHADRQGWVPLSAWDGQDIADPDAVAYAGWPISPLVELADDDEPDEQEDSFAFVDPMLRTRALILAAKVDETTEAGNQKTKAFIQPIGRVTRLEAHAIAWIASDAGMNATQIAAMLGYPARDKTEVDHGQRHVNRLRAANEHARTWIESTPAGETPAWFAASRTPGRTDIRTVLPPLMALQPAPYGAGWSVAELAARCAVPEAAMREYLAFASVEGNRLFVHQGPKTRSAGCARRPADRLHEVPRSCAA